MIDRALRMIWGCLRRVPVVKTLDRNGVLYASKELAFNVKTEGFEPSHIVAIANGGIAIAEGFRSVFTEAEILVVKKQRPETAMKVKSSLFKRLIKRCPQVVTTFLRRVEHWSRYIERDYRENPLDIKDIEKLKWPIIRKTPRAVLIVDDAVDTGETIEAVKVSAKIRLGGEVDIRTATLSITGVNPLARCDYTLFYGVNIRFFWSEDF